VAIATIRPPIAIPASAPGDSPPFAPGGLFVLLGVGNGVVDTEFIDDESVGDVGKVVVSVDEATADFGVAVGDVGEVVADVDDVTAVGFPH